MGRRQNLKEAQRHEKSRFARSSYGLASKVTSSPALSPRIPYVSGFDLSTLREQ